MPLAKRVGVMAVSPDGKWIVTGDGRLIDVASGDVRQLDNFTGDVQGLLFSPDGETLLLTVRKGLAAADSKGWSAIVPISHGGDTATAAKLVGIPCWCFHGVADRMIPPLQSREIVAAITKAGGRPLYQEFSGVSHSDCAERVYAMNDLFEWLLAQNRSRR